MLFLKKESNLILHIPDYSELANDKFKGYPDLHYLKINIKIGISAQSSRRSVGTRIFICLPYQCIN